MASGYNIIDFKGVDIGTTGTHKVPGAYKAINKNNGKMFLITNVVLNGVRLPAMPIGFIKNKNVNEYVGAATWGTNEGGTTIIRLYVSEDDVVNKG